MSSLRQPSEIPIARLVAIGLTAGLLSGSFGVGGGILIVPALVLFTAMDQKLAHGTSLAAVVPISIIGASTYLVTGYLNLPAAALLILGTVTGALFGTRLLDSFPNSVLRWSFIVFMVAVALRLLFEVPDRQTQLELTLGTIVVLIVLGLGTGVLSGLLGVGGGVFMVPVLILLLGMSDIIAKGVSLMVVIPTGLVATYFSLKRGHVDLKAAGIVGGSGAVTTVGGAMLAFALDPRIASVLFALFIAAVAIRMAVHAVSEQRADQSTDL